MSDPIESPYSVTVKGPGIAADKAVDLPTALSVLQVIFGGHLSSPEVLAKAQGNALLAAPPRETGVRARPKSVREYLAEIGGKTIHAKIATVGRYVRDHEGQEGFTRDDVKARFRSAGELMPANFPRDFQKALQAGWIGEDPQNKGSYYVTRTGDEAIDRKFEGVPGLPPSRRRRRVGVTDTEQERDEQ